MDKIEKMLSKIITTGFPIIGFIGIVVGLLTVIKGFFILGFLMFAVSFLIFILGELIDIHLTIKRKIENDL